MMSPVRIALVGLSLGFLTACAGLIGEPKSPEQAVAERAQERWEARLADNWETAYSFATPTYRDVVDVAGFEQRHSGMIAVLGAKVREVNCREEVCEATVRLKFRSPLPQMKTDLETDDIERWILEDGDWWIYLKP